MAIMITNFQFVYLFRYGEKERKEDTGMSGTKLFAATLYQLKNKYQILLIPLTIWIGMEQAFIGADFTEVSLI